MRKYFAPVVLVILILALFGPILLMGNNEWTGDFDLHFQFAQELRETGSLAGLPHFLYHLGIITTGLIAPDLAPYLQARVPVMLSYIFLGLIMYTLLVSDWGIVRRNISPWLAILAVIIMLSITPILVFAANFYLLGYVNPTTYHNPTQIVLKLWIIPVSVLAWRAVEPASYRTAAKRAGIILLTAALVILMSLTKPSYTIALLPGLALYTLVRLLQRHRIDWPLLLLGIVLPSVVVLAWQYLGTFTGDDGSRVAIGFMTFQLHYTPSVKRLLVMFMASLAFPLSIYALYFQRARRDQYLNLSWVVFIFGALLSYFFYESGPRQAHGNFGWSSYAAIFVLMFASLAFMLREVVSYAGMAKSRINWRLAVVLSVLGLHMVSAGVVWWAFALKALTN